MPTRSILRLLADFEEAAIVLEGDPAPLLWGKLSEGMSQRFDAGRIQLDFVVATTGRIQLAANLVRESHPD